MKELGKILNTKYLCLHEEWGTVEVDGIEYRLISNIGNRDLIVREGDSDRLWMVTMEELFRIGVENLCLAKEN